jgi:hypothetical protein
MNAEQEQKLIELKARGATDRTTGQAIGLNHSNVNRQSNKPSIKERIKALQEKIITELSDTAYNNLKHAIDYYKTPVSTKQYTDSKGKIHILQTIDEQLREHGAKFSLEVLRAAAALPSHNVSLFIQNIYNDNRSEIPQVIKDILESVTHRDLNQINLLTEFESINEAGNEGLNASASEIIDIDNGKP